VKIEEPFFTLKIRPGLSPEQRMEVNSALCRIAIDPPRSDAERKRIAIRAAMNLYEGSPFSRANQLADRYRAYLASGWNRERDLESLPDPRSAERTLLHRLARLNDGASLGWRQILRLADESAASETPRSLAKSASMSQA
jgi:hypothetical protein